MRRVGRGRVCPDRLCIAPPEAWPAGGGSREQAGRSILPGVKLKDNEPLEIALKRFKKQCEKAGLMYEMRKREHYEKPSVRRKKKAVAARKRALKKLRQVN